MFGSFDKVFDFNGDGNLDTFEKAAEFATFTHIMDSIDKENEDECKETLEDAGLDPDEYDF